MANASAQAFSETYDIINHMEKELYNKISKKFIKFLEENRDVDYVVNIDYTKSINEQKLLKETRIILSLVYRDYICSSEKKHDLIEKDKKKYKEEQKALQEKYALNFETGNSNNNFDSSIQIPDNILSSEQSLIEIHEDKISIKDKIYYFFKRFFNK